MIVLCLNAWEVVVMVVVVVVVVVDFPQAESTKVGRACWRRELLKHYVIFIP